MRPDDKVLIAGGTGKGKTVLECYIADKFLDVQPKKWQQIIIDTQQDDLVNFPSKSAGWATKDLDEFKHWIKRTDLPRITFLPENEYDTEEVYDEIFQSAYERKYCTLVLDELSALVPARKPLTGFKNVIQRGRAKHVGVIALVQDPVYIPRTIKSQTGYMILFPNGSEYRDEFVKKWIPSEYGHIYNDFPTEHGFYIWMPSNQDFEPQYVKGINIDPHNVYNHPSSCECIHCRERQAV